MDRRIFYSLQNIEIKEARIKCRILFLEKCVSYNIVPYGLQICKKPVLGKSSESFFITVGPSVSYILRRIFAFGHF